MKQLFKAKEKVRIMGGINQAFFNSKEDAVKFTGAIKCNSNTQYRTDFSAHSINEYATAATNGQVIIPAELRNGEEIRKEGFVSQQLFMLDVDNVTKDKAKHGQYKTAKDLLKHLQSFSISSCFIYPTYSSSEELERYRVAFVVDERITDLNRRNEVLRALASLFVFNNESIIDTGCVDVARIFYGTNKGLFHLDETALVDTDYLLEITKDMTSLTSLDQANTASVTTAMDAVDTEIKSGNEFTAPLIVAIQSCEVEPYRHMLNESLKSKIGTKELNILNTKISCTDFTSNARTLEFRQFMNETKQLPLHLLLGLPLNQKFNCILHKDSTPSAQITYSEEYGYQYFCWGSSCACNGRSIDMYKIFSIITGSNAKAMKFLCGLLGVQVETVFRSMAVAQIDELIKYVLDTDLRTILTAKEKQTYYGVLKEAKHFICNYSLSKAGEVAFYIPGRTLAKLIGKAHSTVTTHLSKLVMYGFLKKLSDEEISAPTLSSLKKQQEAMGELMGHETKFRKDVFVIPSVESLNLKEAESTAKRLRERGYNNASFNSYTIKKTEGTSAADKVFVQLKGSDSNSKHREHIVEIMKRTIVMLLDRYGYVTKNLILSELQNKITEKEYKANFPIVSMQLELINKSASKVVCEELGIEQQISTNTKIWFKRTEINAVAHHKTEGVSSNMNKSIEEINRNIESESKQLRGAEAREAALAYLADSDNGSDNIIQSNGILKLGIEKMLFDNTTNKLLKDVEKQEERRQVVEEQSKPLSGSEVIKAVLAEFDDSGFALDDRKVKVRWKLIKEC